MMHDPIVPPVQQDAEPQPPLIPSIAPIDPITVVDECTIRSSRSIRDLGLFRYSHVFLPHVTAPQSVDDLPLYGRHALLRRLSLLHASPFHTLLARPSAAPHTISHIVFHPRPNHARVLAVSSTDGSLHVFAHSTAAPQNPILSHDFRNAIEVIRWDPFRTPYLACGFKSSRDVSIVDVHQRKEAARASMSGGGSCKSLAFAPQTPGVLYAGARDGRVRVFDSSSGVREQMVLQDLQTDALIPGGTSIRHVFGAPDGKSVWGVKAAGVVVQWDVRTQRRLRSFWPTTDAKDFVASCIDGTPDVLLWMMHQSGKVSALAADPRTDAVSSRQVSTPRNLGCGKGWSDGHHGGYDSTTGHLLMGSEIIDVRSGARYVNPSLAAMAPQSVHATALCPITGHQVVGMSDNHVHVLG
jgi:WD40 repeat protein